MSQFLLLDPFKNIVNVHWAEKISEIPGPSTIYVGAFVEISWAIGQSTFGFRNGSAEDGHGNRIDGVFAGPAGTNYSGEPAGRTGAMSIVLLDAAIDGAMWRISDSEGLTWDYSATWDANFVSNVGAIY